MNIKFDNITFNVRFRYEPVYLIRIKHGAYEFKTSDEVAAMPLYMLTNCFIKSN